MSQLKKPIIYGLGTLGIVFLIALLGSAVSTQIRLTCSVTGSGTGNEQGLFWAQIRISVSVPPESPVEIQGADLFLVTDLSLALAERAATDSKQIEASLATTVVRAWAHGAAVVFGRDLQTNQPQILCGGRGGSVPGSFSPAPSLESRFSQIISENIAGMAINANTEPLALGVNSALLVIRNNQSSIEIAGNLPSIQSSAEESGQQNLKVIRVENNSGTITLGINHSRIEILNNSGEITVQINRPLGVIEVMGNTGAIRVINNQGTIQDATGTVQVGQGQ